VPVEVGVIAAPASWRPERAARDGTILFENSSTYHVGQYENFEKVLNMPKSIAPTGSLSTKATVYYYTVTNDGSRFEPLRTYIVYRPYGKSLQALWFLASVFVLIGAISTFNASVNNRLTRLFGLYPDRYWRRDLYSKAQILDDRLNVDYINEDSSIAQSIQSTKQSQEETSEPTSKDLTSGNSEVDEQSTTLTDDATSDSKSTFDRHRTAAEAAIETADDAESNDHYGEAADAYSEALSEYQAAINTLDPEATNERVEIEKKIESTRADLEAVKTQREQQNEIIEALQSAERSLQEAIVAYIEDDQTLARIRFRQARDTFEDAHETIAESEDDLLTEPVAVEVQPDREPSSGTLDDLAAIPETAAAKLANSGIEAVDNLDTGDEPPWTPAAVEELVGDEMIDEDVATTLTLLAWWHGDESYTFETAEEIETRQQKADYGFNQIS
jgi:hypothetical protein